MTFSTLINPVSADDTPRSTRMHLKALGWALTSTLVGMFVICYLLSFVWPTSGLAHGWVLSSQRGLTISFGPLSRAS